MSGEHVNRDQELPEPKICQTTEQQSCWSVGTVALLLFSHSLKKTLSGCRTEETKCPKSQNSGKQKYRKRIKFNFQGGPNHLLYSHVQILEAVFNNIHNG